MGDIQLGRWSVHPMQLFAWLLILLWMGCTIFLADYYLTTHNMISAHLWSLAPLSTHARLSAEDAAALGLGLSPAPTVEQAEQSLSRLMELRAVQKDGNLAARANETAALLDWVSQSSSEPQKMSWAPILACAPTGCGNPTFIRTAGRLAAGQPMLAGNAIAIEAAYWYEAQTSGDAAGVARAIARLDFLVRNYGNADLATRWGQLQACGGACPLFEEQLLDFITAASKL
ncbi:MAG: hypothetical protein KGH63_03750 [Candidatus Micrarchaeota archaeon]|nr:hypothetical protein [Candidatus Micrarchaeota archaeon]